MNKTAITIALLVVGLANAAAIWIGFALVSATIQQKSFTSSFNASQDQNVVPLSGDRFAVIDNRFISVYQVDSKGKITRESDVDTFFREIQPNTKRQSAPEPYVSPSPTPIPSPTPTPKR